MQDFKDCQYPEQHKLCRLLAKAGVPAHPKWYSLILYMRSLQYNDTLSDGQKSDIHQLFLEIISERDFSDARYDEVSRRQEEIVTTPYRERLKAVIEESTSLLQEFGSLMTARKGQVADLGEETVETVQSGLPPEEMVDRLRESFRRVIETMEKDTEDLKRVAWTDALTGLANRRRFDEVLGASCEEAKKGSRLSLLMLDIDLFKRINDTYGHPIGDQALKVVAEIIRQCAQHGCGERCLCARYGGEEFSVIVPEKGATHARDVAELIRRNIEQNRFEIESVDGEILEEGLAMTISVGVAELDEAWTDNHAKRLVQAADSALYEAKRGGRNQVRVFGEE